MPFYHALVRPGLGTDAERQAFAGDVVDIHCGITGAPRSFVHVLFSDDVGGSLAPHHTCSVRGTIRSGRTDGQKDELVSALRRAFADRTGVHESTVAVETGDIDASFTMEGGQLLPEPGSAEEDAWKVSDAHGTSS